MSTFEFKSPDGKTYVIEGPDGATKEQAFGILQQQISSGSIKATTAPAKPAPDQSALRGSLASDNVKQTAMGVVDNLVGSGLRDRVAGALRGAGSIGATALAPIDVAMDAMAGKGLSLESNRQRRANMDHALGQFGADTQSGNYGIGKIAAEIAGTAGAPTVIANGLRAVSPGAKTLAAAIESGGFNLGAHGGSKLANIGARTAGGTVSGGISAGMVDPDHASTGMMYGAALPVGMQAARGVAGAIGNKIVAAQEAQLLKQAQNSPRDATLQSAKDSGYVLSPSEANPTKINHLLEGIAGKLSTRQLASQENQAVSNALARKALNLSESTPLTSELMQKIRKDAYQAGYAPVENAGNVATSSQFGKDLDKLVDTYQGAARSFPGAADDTVKNFVGGLKVQSFDAGDAIKMTQLLRDQAKDAFRKGESGLGLAKRGAAKAIEDEMERALVARGAPAAELLKNFRDARTLMAKAHTVEDALKEGSGNVIASKLAARLQAGKPLSGELKTIAETANVFPKNMQSPEMMGAVPGFSPLDVFTGAGLGVMGAGATGDQWGALAALTPMMRPAARSALLSKPYQKMATTPNYNQGVTQKLIQALTKNVEASAPIVDPVLARVGPLLLREQ